MELLDHRIRPLQERRRDRQAERLGGLEVDDQLELGRLLDGEISRLGPLENLVDIEGGPPIVVRHVDAVRHEPAIIHERSNLALMPWLAEFHSTVTRESFGTACLSKSSRLAAICGAIRDSPLTLPPGWARLSTVLPSTSRPPHAR